VRDVERVVCGEGPGSFTSLRIAGAIAKGIAFGNVIPLFAVSSLALVVAGARELRAGTYLAVLDAMRGERFIAPFARLGDGSLTVLGPAARVTSEEAAQVAARGFAVPVGPLESTALAPHARGVAPLLDAIIRSGAVSVDAWEPAYGRLAEAQVKWEAAHGRPLQVL
jgi:tRNA threonylcarbamoyladenosine biosynthesis protein TsaB